MSRLKETLHESVMIDGLVKLIDKHVDEANKEYTQTIKKLIVQMSSIKKELQKDPRYDKEIRPYLEKAVMDKIVSKEYSEELIDVILHFWARG